MSIGHDHSRDACLAKTEARGNDQDQRLMAILEKYLVDMESGNAVDPETLIAENPDVADKLRGYLESLRLLQHTAIDLSDSHDDPAGTSAPPQQLGDFEIVREIGRGGMGVVYEARQISLRRRVALKVLPFAGMLDPKQVARFSNEAQAAAQLHHPHIVPVYAVGCERGIHYFAMQLVEGQSLETAIDELRNQANLPVGDPKVSGDSERELPGGTTADAALQGTWRGFSTARARRREDFFRQAATLARQAAEGLQHAHDFGIIHRDIKPSNLLLDGQGQLWIADFGLARTHKEAGVTLTGDIVGTLRYMSPEQAAGRAALVDHRTDVYALGVTLYELLTLRHAFDGEHGQALLRQIEQSEPPEPRAVDSAIPYDLETIVLKAISKSREDRYETAGEMAADLQRYLEGRATVARRPSLVVRAGKWLQRHQAAMAVAIGVLLFSVVGLTAATVMISAEQSRTEAALVTARRNFEESEHNRQRAERFYRQAREAVDRLGVGHAEQLAHVPGAESLRQSLLRATLSYYDQFLSDAAEDESLVADLARTRFKAAALTEQIGDAQRAREGYEQAIRLFTELARDEPQVADHRRSLGLCHNNLALLLNALDESTAASEEVEKAIAIALELVKETSSASVHLADLALAQSNAALIASRRGNVKASEAAYSAAIRTQRQLQERAPDEPGPRSALAVSLDNFAFLLASSDPQRADTLYQDALKLHEGLVQDFPASLGYSADLALCLNNLGSLANRTGQLEQARANYQRAVEIQERLARRAPAMHRYRADLAISYNNLGQIANRLSETQLAQESFQRARRVLEQLQADQPDDLGYASSLAGVANNEGLLFESQGNLVAASSAFEAAIRAQASVLQKASNVPQYREFLSKHYFNRSRVLRDAGQFAQAKKMAESRAKLWSDRPERLYSVAAELSQIMGAAQAADASSKAIDETRGALEEVLARAFHGGYATEQRIAEDARFDSIRESGMLKEIVSSLKKRESE